MLPSRRCASLLVDRGGRDRAALLRYPPAAVDRQLRRAVAGDKSGTMTEAITVDAARLPLLLGELRLPAIGAL